MSPAFSQSTLQGQSVFIVRSSMKYVAMTKEVKSVLFKEIDEHFSACTPIRSRSFAGGCFRGWKIINLHLKMPGESPAMSIEAGTPQPIQGAYRREYVSWTVLPATRAFRNHAKNLLRFAVFSLLAAHTLLHAQVLPSTLAETGFPQLGQASKLQLNIAEFSPQYPLWSDGAQKRRWLYLPSGAFIDASKPDAWSFPTGTRLWKQFSYDGRPVETRYMEKKGDGRWLFATYIWNADASSATLAPDKETSVKVAAVPGGRYVIPSRRDCMACHGSAPVPVLGLTTLQLSPDRDSMALSASAPRPNELDLRALVARGWVKGLPKKLLEQPPRIAGDTPVERAVLGYLHGNCGHCHNTSKFKVPLSLTLAQRAADPAASRDEVLHSTVEQNGRYGQSDAISAEAIIKPGQPEQSLLLARMRSRQPQTQMPPLGTTVPDAQAIDFITRWIVDMKN